MRNFYKLFFTFIVLFALCYESNSFAEETPDSAQGDNSAQRVSKQLNELINEQLHPGSLKKQREADALKKKQAEEEQERKKEEQEAKQKELNQPATPPIEKKEDSTPIGVILKQDVYVNGDFITLGDIFDNTNEKANIIIDHAPNVGSKKLLSTTTLKRIAKANNLQWNPYVDNPTIIIQRKSITISNDYIESIIKKALKNKDGFKIDGTYKLKLDRSVFNWVIPADHYDTLALSNLSYDSDTGYFQASFSTKNMKDKRIIHGYVVEMIDVPILINSKAKGDIIKDDDIEYISVEKRKIVRNTILEPEQLIGKQAKKNIDINKVVKIYDVGRAIAVKKKSLITIVYKTKMINLEAQGKALESGGIGDVIKVENLNSKVTVSATIIDIGKVQVGINK